MCHAVLEAAGRGELLKDGADDWHAAFDRLWDEQIREQRAQAERSPFERHFGPPERWPGYELKRAYLEAQVARLVQGRRMGSGQDTHVSGTVTAGVEREYVAFDGRLAGRVDHVAYEEGQAVIEDYKSGVILEENGLGVQELKASYRRQLLLYAALYFGETGSWPARARIIPLRGAPVTVDVDPAEALAEAQSALSHLATYQALFASGPDVAAMAKPSPASCAFCSYKALCPEFWAAVAPDWNLGGVALEGPVRARADVQGTVSLSVEVTRGNVAPETYLLQGLHSAQFPDADKLAVGEHLRAVNCRRLSNDDSQDLRSTPYTQVWEVGETQLAGAKKVVVAARKVAETRQALIAHVVKFSELQDADLSVGVVYEGGAFGGFGDDPLSRLVPGLGNQGGFRKVQPPGAEFCRLAILYTTFEDPEWPDYIDPATSTLTYYGDNKRPGRALLDTPRGGNRLLKEVFAQLHDRQPPRSRIPPFFVFALSPTAGSARSVQFCGLAAPGHVDLEADADLKQVTGTIDGSRFENYRAVFTLLNARTISRQWLSELRDGNALGPHCPAAWRSWLECGVYDPLPAV